VTGVPGELRPVTAAERPLVLAWVRDFHVEAEGGTDPDRAAEITDARLNSATGGLALWWHDQRPVSLVGYTGPTPHGIRIGPVYTPPDLRGHGYARAAVAALSQQLLDGGRRFCCLFADLANPASNRLYQSIGYAPVCDMDEYRFG
jgi:predicted GNAT family acetyltransferase